MLPQCSFCEHRKQGKLAQAAGRDFEAWVDAQHEMAMRLGVLAHIEHTEPHAKMLGGKLIYTSAGVADFVGVLAGGKALAVEAKSVADWKLPMSRISPKQQAHLGAVSRAGGVALLLIEFRVLRGYKHRYAVPWKDIPWMKNRTALSVHDTSLTGWRVENCYLTRFCDDRMLPTTDRKFARE